MTAYSMARHRLHHQTRRLTLQLLLRSHCKCCGHSRETSSTLMARRPIAVPTDAEGLPYDLPMNFFLSMSNTSFGGCPCCFYLCLTYLYTLICCLAQFCLPCTHTHTRNRYLDLLLSPMNLHYDTSLRHLQKTDCRNRNEAPRTGACTVQEGRPALHLGFSYSILPLRSNCGGTSITIRRTRN